MRWVKDKVKAWNSIQVRTPFEKELSDLVSQLLCRLLISQKVKQGARDGYLTHIL